MTKEERTTRKQVIDRHHRKPRSMGGSNKERNISRVRKHYHRAFHTLFGNGDPAVVARILNEVWIDPDYELVLVKKGGP